MAFPFCGPQGGVPGTVSNPDPPCRRRGGWVTVEWRFIRDTQRCPSSAMTNNMNTSLTSQCYLRYGTALTYLYRCCYRPFYPASPSSLYIQRPPPYYPSALVESMPRLLKKVESVLETGESYETEGRSSPPQKNANSLVKQVKYMPAYRVREHNERTQQQPSQRAIAFLLLRVGLAGWEKGSLGMFFT